MKWLVSIFVILSMTLIWGCGGDDDDVVDPVIGSPRIVVSESTSGSAIIDPQASVWATVDSATVEVSTGNPPAKLNPSLATSVTNEVKVKAATRNDSLYIWFQWVDATNDVWPNNWTLTQVTPSLNYDSSLFDFEDQMFVMFHDVANAGWDVWNWRVITTGAENLAEGMNWYGIDNTLIADEYGTVDLPLAVRNKAPGFAMPEFVHQDTCEYTDSTILFIEEAISRNYWIVRGVDDSVHWYQTSGWQVDDKIPGWHIDGSVSERSDAQRGSRWDIGASSIYSGGMYSLVLVRKLFTGYTDDFNLSNLDSVKVQLGVLNNKNSFTEGSSNRGYSEDFWLIF